MKSKLLGQGGRVFAVVFATGEEVSAGLLQFAERNGISGASFTAIGAFSRATLAFFSLETKEYEEIPVDRQMEVLSLTGNIGLAGGRPKLHAHAVVGLRDGGTLGGHLLAGVVRPTLEVIVTETDGELCRVEDPETGLPLIDPDR